MKIIDSHQHFWKYQPAMDSWITDEMDVLRRDYLPPDYEKQVLQRSDVRFSVAVQADQTEEETDFLLALTEKYPFIAGVVGWIDLRADDIEKQLENRARYSKLCGFRHIVQGEPDVNFLLRSGFRRGIEALERHGFSYDILVYPHQLGAALELVRRFPNQAFVIDHLAKPYIADGFIDGWEILIREIALYDNVYCKVSGMITEAEWSGWRYEDLLPYLDVVLEAFGPGRLMFGSDWPVCLVAGGVGEWLEVTTRFSSGLSPAERQRIFWQNTVDFYRLDV